MVHVCVGGSGGMYTAKVCMHKGRGQPRLFVPAFLLVTDLRGGRLHHTLQPEKRDGGGLL